MKKPTITVISLAVLLIAACSSNMSKSNQPDTSKISGFPAKIASCDEELVFKKPPEKVVIFNALGAVEMNELGVLDKVVARTGAPDGGLDPELEKKIDSIKTLSTVKNDTGGSVVQTEVIQQTRADLVIGYDAGVDREALRKSGIKLYTPPSYCPSSKEKQASFNLVDDEIRKFGAIFGAKDKAETYIKKLSSQRKNLKPPAKANETIAFLMATPGSSTIYAYGNSATVQPISEVNGVKNIYGDQVKRVFEVSIEDLLKKNPTWIVLLSSDEKASETKKSFISQPAINKLTAVKKDHVLTLAFGLTNPPSPLTIKGAVELGKLLAEKSK